MITHASLFSGIGAADLAAEELGWRNVFNCEINEFCRMVLDYHFPEADKYKDIYKVNFRKYEGTINVLSGGFPCQAFSVAGRRKGTEDDRYLWPQMRRAIAEIKPDYVLGENVVGILSMVSSIGEPSVAHQASLFGEGDNIVTQRGQYVADIIREDLEREGYTLQIFVIPACAIGAPHQRNRVWFIAKRNVANTESEQGQRMRPIEPEDSGAQQGQLRGGDIENREHGGAITDTLLTGLERHPSLRIQGDERGGNRYGLLGRFAAFHSSSRWRMFPATEPVICRGDDGISERLDTGTISFAKWRCESIKAYGNSMVMPLVKEIFKAIQKDIEHDREIR